MSWDVVGIVWVPMMAVEAKIIWHIFERYLRDGIQNLEDRLESRMEERQVDF